MLPHGIEAASEEELKSTQSNSPCTILLEFFGFILSPLVSYSIQKDLSKFTLI